MRRALALWGVAVFLVALLLGSPAAFWLGGLPWPPGWAPQSVSGTLWQGQAQHLGQLSALRWSLAPTLAGGRAELRGVALEQQWRLQLDGWPWAWTARLDTLGNGPQADTPVRLAGDWQGHIQLRGARATCLSSEGNLSVARLDLLAPWGMPLGAARVDLDCQTGIRLRASLLRPGAHRLGFEGDLLARHGTLSGDFEAQSELAALVRQFGLMAPAERQFARALDW